MLSLLWINFSDYAWVCSARGPHTWKQRAVRSFSTSYLCSKTGTINRYDFHNRLFKSDTKMCRNWQHAKCKRDFDALNWDDKRSREFYYDVHLEVYKLLNEFEYVKYAAYEKCSRLHDWLNAIFVSYPFLSRGTNIS